MWGMIRKHTCSRASADSMRTRPGVTIKGSVVEDGRPLFARRATVVRCLGMLVQQDDAHDDAGDDLEGVGQTTSAQRVNTWGSQRALPRRATPIPATPIPARNVSSAACLPGLRSRCRPERPSGECERPWPCLCRPFCGRRLPFKKISSGRGHAASGPAGPAARAASGTAASGTICQGLQMELRTFV